MYTQRSAHTTGATQTTPCFPSKPHGAPCRGPLPARQKTKRVAVTLRNSAILLWRRWGMWFVRCRWHARRNLGRVGAVVGSAYGFSVYSRAIKQRFGLSQGELDAIPAVSAAMGLFSALLGAVHDSQGPLFSTVIGGCTVTIGLCLQFLLITLLPVPSQGSGDSGSFSFGSGTGTGSGISTMTVTVLVAAASSLTYLGGAILTAAVFATICVNFPRHKGTVVGLGKAWLGLGSWAEPLEDP